MQVYNRDEYVWNRCVGPNGNMGKVSPQIVADLCDKYNIPWYTYGQPYSSGITAYCKDDELWKKILAESKY